MDEWFLGFMTLWPSPSLAWILCYFVVLYALLSILNKRFKDPEEGQNGSNDTEPLDGRPPWGVGADLSGVGTLPPIVSRFAGALRWRGFHRASHVIERYAPGTAIALLSAALIVLLYGGYQSPSTQGADWCNSWMWDKEIRYW